MGGFILSFGLILLLLYLIASFFIAYHLIRFGTGVETKILTLVFIAGLVVLIILLFVSYFSLDLNALKPNL